MGIVADAMRKAERKAGERLERDSIEAVMEDAHDTFRFTKSSSYGQRAHAYIDAYGIESVRTKDGTAVLSVVEDLIGRAIALGAAEPSLAGRVEELEGRLVDCGDVFERMEGLCREAKEACRAEP